MSSPTNTLRHRGEKSSKKTPTTPTTVKDDVLDTIVKQSKAASNATSEWDFKLALAVITGLSFLTRFWGINHPDQVVFDEVHFGKVRLDPVAWLLCPSSGRFGLLHEPG